jgi:uncharacterized phage-associated protein
MHTEGEGRLPVDTPRYKAMTIAKWFIAWAEAEEEELSNMKLQKLLYYAQGHHLAQYQRPLFDGQIEAWSHGPVVPQVYRAFKKFGRSPIQLPESDPFTWDEVDADTTEFLGKVWNTYGGYSAGRLRTMTHDEPPWQNHWLGEDEFGGVIPDGDMQLYFHRLETGR